jgi:hypothetical protein
MALEYYNKDIQNTQQFANQFWNINIVRQTICRITSTTVVPETTCYVVNLLFVSDSCIVVVLHLNISCTPYFLTCLVTSLDTTRITNACTFFDHFCFLENYCCRFAHLLSRYIVSTHCEKIRMFYVETRTIILSFNSVVLRLYTLGVYRNNTSYSCSFATFKFNLNDLNITYKFYILYVLGVLVSRLMETSCLDKIRKYE